jgi:hypothetical protein
MSKAKLVLSNEQLEEAFFDSSWLIGIMAPAKDYQLCWNLNRALGFNFRANNELEICLESKQKKFYFTVFEFEEPTKTVWHYIFNNHYKAEFLLPELKNVDYIWMLKGDFYQQSEVRLLMDQIREVPSVQLVTLLKPDELKNKRNLIF